MFKDVEDIERSWRSLKVEMSSYCNILHAMMTKVCVTVCAKCLIFFNASKNDWRWWDCRPRNTEGDLAFGLNCDSVGRLGIDCPIGTRRDAVQWYPMGLMLRFDAWVWYVSQGVILALNKTRRNPMRTSQSYAARLSGSVNTCFARFSSPEVAPIPDYWSPVNDTQRHLQTILERK